LPIASFFRDSSNPSMGFLVFSANEHRMGIQSKYLLCRFGLNSPKLLPLSRWTFIQYFIVLGSGFFQPLVSWRTSGGPYLVQTIAFIFSAGRWVRYKWPIRWSYQLPVASCQLPSYFNMYCQFFSGNIKCPAWDHTQYRWHFVVALPLGLLDDGCAIDDLRLCRSKAWFRICIVIPTLAYTFPFAYSNSFQIHKRPAGHRHRDFFLERQKAVDRRKSVSLPLLMIKLFPSNVQAQLRHHMKKAPTIWIGQWNIVARPFLPGKLDKAGSH